MAHKFKPSYTSSIAEDIMAERLIRAKAVEFLTEEPMRLKSGLISPVYVDNRKLFYYPEAWSDVIETMASRVEEFDLSFDIVAGVEAAGSMHAAALAYRLRLPAIMVRREAKTYGNRSRIEGGCVKVTAPGCEFGCSRADIIQKRHVQFRKIFLVSASLAKHRTGGA